MAQELDGPVTIKGGLTVLDKNGQRIAEFNTVTANLLNISLVGSIGVRMDSFGFVDALQKLGVERRLLTAGEHKGFLDPFLPLDATEVSHVKKLLREIHQQFINTVLKGRKDRIKQTPELFSGLVWTGEKAIELGLVDALGSAQFVARDIVKADEIVDFTPDEGLVERVSKRFGTQLKGSLRAWLAPGW